MILEEQYQKAKNSHKKLKNKKVLLIGSESYDAPMVTLIQGLDDLGVEVYTINKANINSWFCNKIINDPGKYKFDFILSSLHWGTRWRYYKKYNLDGYLKVLMDGDDNRHYLTSWQDKYEHFKKKYKYEPDEKIKDAELSPFRWVEDLAGYEPDVVFTLQKLFSDKTKYFPLGLQRDFIDLAENKSTKERSIDFIHIPGPGVRRKRMEHFITMAKLLHIVPGRVINGFIRGNVVAPEEIKDLIEIDKDRYAHSYNRWLVGREYFRALNDAKVSIYPGIHKTPQWDSKRPWEAYASGCLVLISRPNIDVSEYPITELSRFSVYDTYREFVSKCRFLYKNQDFLDKERINAIKRVNKYFIPRALANYFLNNI